MSNPSESFRHSDYNIVSDKFEIIGFNTNSEKWAHSYLANKFQQVEGHSSSISRDIPPEIHSRTLFFIYLCQRYKFAHFSKIVIICWWIRMFSLKTSIEIKIVLRSKFTSFYHGLFSHN